MFEIPRIETDDGGSVYSTLRELSILGHVCSEMSITYQYAEVSLADSEISLGRSQYTHCGSEPSFYGDIFFRRIREASRYRDGIAILYTEALFGYALALSQIHGRVSSGQSVQPSIVALAMMEKTHTGIIEKLLTSPPTTAAHAGNECDRRLVSAFEAARSPLSRMLWALQGEGVDQIGDVITSGRPDLCGIIFDSVRHVHRYAESMHFGLKRLNLRAMS